VGNVIELQRRHPDWALDRLNRITGLDFARMPVSLLQNKADTKKPAVTAGFDGEAQSVEWLSSRRVVN